MLSNRRALIVGIEDYQILPRLDYAHNDAEAMNEVLKEYACQFSCRLLKGADASAKMIRMEFRSLFTEADDDAVLLFYFAGHGVTQADNTFLITLENEEDPDSCVDLRRLTDLVREYRKSRQSCVFILDCCHSGALPTDELIVSIENIQTLIATSSAGITLLAAADSTEQSKESDKYKQGVFTYWICEGLLGGAANGDGNVTPNSLHDYVSSCMKSTNSQHRPVLKTTIIGTSPILATGFEPRSDIQVSMLNDAVWQEIEDNTQTTIQVIKQKTDYVTDSIWESKLFREASQQLSRLIEWRKDLEYRYPELKVSDRFKRYETDIGRIQIELAKDLRPGTVLIDGVVDGQIGMGGFGTVYRVQGKSRLEAYKVYHANQLHEKEKLKAFQRGYKAMDSLDHPNIVKVIRYTHAPVGFFMQYIDGENFRDWWTDDTARVMNVLHVIAETLQHAHSRGVIHRDIKPENIIVLRETSDRDKPMAFLTDFDLAWYSMATTYSTMGSQGMAAFGHYLYAAPEQYERPGEEITRKVTADVYGFGQLCYFAICGKDPARDAKMSVDSLKAHIKSWPSVEAANKFITLYETCIDRVASHRYQNMADVSSVLLQVRDELIDPNESRQLDEQQFIDELTFALFGFERNPQRNFLSRSDRTEVQLLIITPNRIEIRFEVSQEFASMTGTFESQRSNLSRRVSEAINELKRDGLEVVHQPDKSGHVMYATKINLQGRFMTLSGVSKVRELIQSVLHQLEL